MTNSKRPQILIIDPAVKSPELENFNRLSEISPLCLSYHLPALFGFNSLKATEKTEVKGIIILGSLSSVNDKLPWQEELGHFLKKHFDKKTPLLGLCFGHQLVAHLFGGKVQYVFPDQKKHLGFREVALQSNPLWGEACRGALYVSHNEHVVSAPSGFTVSATSPEIPIEGLAHPSMPIWTFQPHPEAGPKFLEQREKRPAADPSQFRFGQELVQRFLNFCGSK